MLPDGEGATAGGVLADCLDVAAAVAADEDAVGVVAGGVAGGGGGILGPSSVWPTASLQPTG